LKNLFLFKEAKLKDQKVKLFLNYHMQLDLLLEL